MQVNVTEETLYEQMGRLYVANMALAKRLAEVTAENDTLRDTCDKLASIELPAVEEFDPPAKEAESHHAGE